MDEPERTPEPEELLAHAAWLRRLAASLLRDEAAADDVLQETWTAALEKPPRRPGALRAWLARVTRNRAARHRREERRRRGRERRAARPEAVRDPAAEALERAELQQRLIAHVLALEEPYRTAVLLRFFEGLEPAEIARRQEIPLTTFRSRLARALELLRGRLARDFEGEGRSFSAALAPLAGLEPVSPAAAGAGGGGLAAGLKGAMALAAAALIATALLGPERRTEVPPAAPHGPILGFTYAGENPQGFPEYRHDLTGLLFVRLPGGEVTIGGTEGEPEPEVIQWPRRQVILSPFLIAKRQVSLDDWERLLGPHNTYARVGSVQHEGWLERDDPVHLVSWVKCQEFCREAGLSLPSEAQWEHACRESHPAAPGEPNAFGLEGLHGWVRELCEDELREEPAPAAGAPERDPVAGLRYGSAPERKSFFAPRGPWRVVRYGCLCAAAGEGPPASERHVRDGRAIWFRHGRSPSWAEPGLSFRPVRNLRLDESRPLEEVERVLASGGEWEDVREVVTALSRAGDRRAVALIRRFLEEGEPAPLEAEAALAALRRLHPPSGLRAADQLLRSTRDLCVLAEAGLLLLEAGETARAQEALAEVLRLERRGSHELPAHTYLLAAASLIREGSELSRKLVEEVMADDPMTNLRPVVRARLARELEPAGSAAGLRWYRDVLKVKGTRLGRTTFSASVDVIFADEVLELLAPHEPLLADLRGRTASGSDERIAAVAAWLAAEVERVEAR
jgi:RNA polymerase sigma-70 factor (ECF subfamily)